MNELGVFIGKISFFIRKVSQGCCFLSVLYLNCCFIFEDVVNSCRAPPMRLTRCFHFVTYNKHKVLILPGATAGVVFRFAPVVNQRFSL